jgi:outer membrane biosynthesis protein TonB
VTRILTAKDPNNPLGYLWEAKSKARQDAESKGLAEANYTKYLQMTEAETDAAKKQGYKNEMINAYYYMAILNLKKYKSLSKAHEFANKMLALDPANANAKNVLSFQQKDLDPKPAASQTAPKKPAAPTKPQPKTSGAAAKSTTTTKKG